MEDASPDWDRCRAMLRAWIEKHGHSHSEAARLIGIERPGMVRFLKEGGHGLNVESTMKVARALGVSMAELLGERAAPDDLASAVRAQSARIDRLIDLLEELVRRKAG